MASFYINRRYNPPEIEIDIQTHSDSEPIPWYEFDRQEVINRIDDREITAPQIFISSRSDSKELKLEKIELHISEDWDLIEPFQQRAQRVGFRQYSLPQETLNWNGSIASGGGQSFSFPFEPKQETCEFKIVVYPTVSASQFQFPVFGNLPRYFGDVSLEPVSESCEISEDD